VFSERRRATVDQRIESSIGYELRTDVYIDRRTRVHASASRRDIKKDVHLQLYRIMFYELVC
jgi:hypothetical protein